MEPFTGVFCLANRSPTHLLTVWVSMCYLPGEHEGASD